MKNYKNIFKGKKRFLKLFLFYFIIVGIYFIIGGFLLYQILTAQLPELSPIDIDLSITFTLSIFISLMLFAGLLSIISQIIALIIIGFGNSSKKIILSYLLNTLSFIGNIVAIAIIAYLLLTEII